MSGTLEARAAVSRVAVIVGAWNTTLPPQQVARPRAGYDGVQLRRRLRQLLSVRRERSTSTSRGAVVACTFQSRRTVTVPELAPLQVCILLVVIAGIRVRSLAPLGTSGAASA